MTCRSCNALWEADARFCGVCGWPGGDVQLARVDGRANPLIEVDPGRPTTHRLEFSNAGHAPAEVRLSLPEGDWCRFDRLPPTVRSRSLGEVGTAHGDTVTATIVVDGSARPPDGALVFEAESFDARGRWPSDHRSWDLGAGWRRWRLECVCRQLRPGQLCMYPSVVLLGPQLREHTVHLRNEGQTPIRVSATGAPAWVKVSATYEPVVTKEDGSGHAMDIVVVDLGAGVEIEGGQEVVILLGQATDGPPPAPVGRIDVRLTGPDGQESTEPLHIVSLWPTSRPEAAHRYSFGVDFGTSTSAVYYVDMAAPDPATWQPNPVYFSVDGQERRSELLPSLARVRKGRPIEFGKSRPRGVLPAGEAYIPDLKLLLRRNEPLQPIPDFQVFPVEILAELFRFLKTSILTQDEFRALNQVPGTVTCSVPVLQSPEAREQQTRNTLDAAAASGLTEIADAGLTTMTEPVCAALDMLHRRTELHFTPNSGDIVMVFDSGAGTTDVCFLRCDFDPDGTPSLEELFSLGYEFGGNDVDVWLVEWFWHHTRDAMPTGHRAHVVTGTQDMFVWVGTEESWVSQISPWVEGRVDEILAGPNPPEGGRDTAEKMAWEEYIAAYAPLVRPARDMTEEARQTKEGEPAPDARVNPFAAIGVVQERANQGVQLDVAATDVKAALEEWVERDVLLGYIFEHGLGERVDVPKPFNNYRDEERRSQSVSAALAEHKISPHDVKWVCLVGGTTLIPSVKRALATYFKAARIIEPPGEERMRSVARGAALGRHFRISGGLPVEVSLWVNGHRQNGHALGIGSAPGARCDPCFVQVPPESEARLEVRAQAGPAYGNIEGVLISHLERGASGEKTSRQAWIEYRRGEQGLELALVVEDPQHPGAAPAEAVCRVP